MNRSSKRFVATLLILPLTLLMAACGGDDDGGSNGGGGGGGGEPAPIRDTSVEPRAEYVEYCDTVEEMLETNASPIESGRAQLEVAPDDLEEDIRLMTNWVELRDGENPDPDAVADAAAEGQPALGRVFTALRAECGITVPLG